MLPPDGGDPQKGTTILMVTHDMGSIIKYCDRVVLLHKGEFIAEGPAGKVWICIRRFWPEAGGAEGGAGSRSP